MKSDFKSMCCDSKCYLYCPLCEKRSTCKVALSSPKISKKLITDIEWTYYMYINSKVSYEREGKTQQDKALAKYYLEELKRLDFKLNYAVMFITSNKKKV